jgi:hypothetical protein
LLVEQSQCLVQIQLQRTRWGQKQPCWGTLGEKGCASLCVRTTAGKDCEKTGDQPIKQWVLTGLSCRIRGAGLSARVERLRQQDPRGWYWRVGQCRRRAGDGELEPDCRVPPLRPRGGQPAADFTRPGLRSARRAIVGKPRRGVQSPPDKQRLATRCASTTRGQRKVHDGPGEPGRGIPEAKHSYRLAAVPRPITTGAGPTQQLGTRSRAVAPMHLATASHPAAKA